MEPADAEDVAAEASIKAMNALHSSRHGETPFVAWLFRTAHNEMVDLFRRRSRNQEIEVAQARAHASAHVEDPETSR